MAFQDGETTRQNTAHEIARLEDRIEHLRDSIERCRKISFAAKAAVAGGGLWFIFVLFILPFNATGFVAATSAVLGGLVLLGSNATTWEQTEVALRDTEAMRAGLIGSIPLRLVDAPSPTLH